MKKQTTKKTATPAAKFTDNAIPGKVAVNKFLSTKSLVVVAKMPSTKGKWEICHNSRSKSFITRLVADNGNILCGNTGFNTLQSAKKNIAAVKASA